VNPTAGQDKSEGGNDFALAGNQSAILVISKPLEQSLYRLPYTGFTF
jgi:hypothetical protein